MITLAQEEARLRGAVCPECLRPELVASLELQVGSECFCIAVCDHCGSTFDAEFSQFESLHQIRERMALAMLRTPCKVCDQRDYELALKCDQPSADCYFEARCRNCNTPTRLKITGNTST